MRKLNISTKENPFALCTISGCEFPSTDEDCIDCPHSVFGERMIKIISSIDDTLRKHLPKEQFDIVRKELGFGEKLHLPKYYIEDFKNKKDFEFTLPGYNQECCMYDVYYENEYIGKAYCWLLEVEHRQDGEFIDEYYYSNFRKM